MISQANELRKSRQFDLVHSRILRYGYRLRHSELTLSRQIRENGERIATWFLANPSFELTMPNFSLVIRSLVPRLEQHPDAYCPKCEKWLETVVVIRGSWADWSGEDQEYVDQEAQMWWQYRCPDCGTVVDGGQT